MDSNQGSCERKPARYQVLLDRAGKAISELETAITTLEKRLDVVLEQPAPAYPVAVEPENTPLLCKLESELSSLCLAMETRFAELKNINSRIQL